MKRKYVYLYLLGLLLFSVACTGNFRDYNTDLSGITDDDLIIDDNGYGIRLGIIQQGIYFNYDFGQVGIVITEITGTGYRKEQ